MQELKIGIIEDELIIARTITNTLIEIGYQTCGPAISYTEGIKLIEQEHPDVLLIDIQLSGKKDGIDLAATINEKYKLPFIFLTANSDAATIERAKKVNPPAYIVKPFTKDDLYSAIEIAFNNFSYKTTLLRSSDSKAFTLKEFVFIKDGYCYRKVYYTDIFYLQSEHNYVSLILKDNKKILVRSSFNEFIEMLPAHLFQRVHRSYVVNINHIVAVESTSLAVANAKIPITIAYKSDLMKVLGIGGK